MIAALANMRSSTKGIVTTIIIAAALLLVGGACVAVYDWLVRRD